MNLRIALVGCGAIARRTHVPVYRGLGDVQLVAFASGHRASAEAAAGEWGSGDVHDEWIDAVTRDDVDAVDICAPNAVHAEIAIAAARAGKHVLVEKPMSVTVADADAMIAAADAAGVLLMPAHNVRGAAPFVAARDAVAAGRIGRVWGVRAALGHGGPESWLGAAATEDTWFRDAARAGGGALLDLGVHVIDALRAVLADDVAEVSAVLSGGAPGVEDTAHVLLRFAGGTTGTVHASWCVQPGPDHQLTLLGEKGTLHLDARTPLTLFRAGTEPVLLPLPADAAHPCVAFAEAVRARSAPPVTAADGRAAVAVVEAAYRSAATGATVRLTGMS